MLLRAGYGGLLLLALGLVSAQTRLPWLFPALGPTLLLRLSPAGPPSASSRNVLLGHVIGLLSGLVALQIGGLLPAQFSTAVAAALAFALTMASGHLLAVDHAPAAATTLIVALGGLPRPYGPGVAQLSVLAICAATPRRYFVRGAR